MAFAFDSKSLEVFSSPLKKDGDEDELSVKLQRDLNGNKGFDIVGLFEVIFQENVLKRLTFPFARKSFSLF